MRKNFEASQKVERFHNEEKDRRRQNKMSWKQNRKQARSAKRLSHPGF